MGMQREVISIPGSIVCTAGHNNQFMIAFHSAPAYDSQNISVMLIQIFGLNIKCKEVRLPLLDGVCLKWMGYSMDCGTPSIQDSNGFVHMYSTKSNCWFPMCNTGDHVQGTADKHFIIDICEKQQVIHSILCRASKYPLTHPRPVVGEIPLNLPLFDLDSERSTMEDVILRNTIFDVENSEMTIKKTALNLFARDCRADKEARAKELVEMIGNPTILELAIKYAVKLGRIHFADRLGELMPTLEEKESQKLKEMEEIEKDEFQILHNISSLVETQETSSPSTVPSIQIAPKPMVLNQKRNPFRRLKNSSALHASPSTTNPLGNLMEKVIEVKPSQDIVEESQDIIEDSQKGEHATPKRNFASWFQENKATLKAQHPKASNEELTKLGMTEFRKSGSSGDSTSTKRKLDENAESTKKQAKLDFGKH